MKIMDVVQTEHQSQLSQHTLSTPRLKLDNNQLRLLDASAKEQDPKKVGHATVRQRIDLQSVRQGGV